MKKSVIIVSVSILLLALGSMSVAQAKGMNSIVDKARFRFLNVTPIEQDDLGITAVNIESDLTPELDLTHHFTENIATELVLATSKHRVNTTSGLDLGDASLLPPTLMAQYHFLPDGMIQPYAGAGVNYTLFYNEGQNALDANSVEYDNSAGWALQAGFDLPLESLSNRMALNVDVKKLYLNTDVSINNGGITTEVDIDPILFGVGITYDL